MVRRLKSTRAAVFLELAMVAPLAVTLVLFAHDFIHICCVELQNEIAARLLSDLESRNVTSNRATVVTQRSQEIVAKYMKMALGEDMLGVETQMTNAPTPGLTKFFTEISKKSREMERSAGEATKDNEGLKTLSAFVGGNPLDLLTLGTHQYLFAPMDSDQMVSASVSVRYRTLLPRPLVSVFQSGGKGREARIVQRSYKLGVKGSDRAEEYRPDVTSFVRHACTMPSFESLPVAQRTTTVTARSAFDAMPIWIQFEPRPDD